MWVELERAIEAGAVIAYGGTPGWAAWLAAQRARNELVIVVGKDDATARELESDVAYFWGACEADAHSRSQPAQGPGRETGCEGGPIAYLPGIDASPYSEVSPDRRAIVERLATLFRLTHPDFVPRIVVASAEALVRKTIHPTELAARGKVIARGDAIERDALGAMLVAGGWSRTPVVDEPGTFALRGGVIDIYAPLSNHPIRIELFGDSVESLRTFDAESQRTLREIDRVIVHPVRETIATGVADVRTRLRAYADEVAFPSKATRQLIEQLEAGDAFIGIEALLPAFHDELVAVSAYVPDHARWIIVDPDGCKRTIENTLSEADAHFGSRASPGGRSRLAFPPEAHFARDLQALALERRIELSTLEVAELGTSSETTQPSTRATKLRVDVDNLRALRHELDHARTFGDTEHVEPLLAAIRTWRANGVAVTIALDSHSRVERIAGVLAARGVTDVTITPAPTALPTASGSPPPGTGESGAGFIPANAPAHAFASTRDRVAFVTGDLIFGKKIHHATTHSKRARDALLGSVSDWSQLAAGDFLVHQRHGLGRYLGLKRIAVSGAENRIDIDMLHIEYDGGSLYLPVFRIGEVQRYVGAEGRPPQLDKLGGSTWLATQTKVSRSVRALTEELLQLYAQRASLPGHRFPPADDQFHELEATFPYDETPDQDQAIRAVLADMEADRAMDRVICGDVGYGKTEVAVRAIFRCVQGGKQACVLAPTTILVEQHFRTFTERFIGFPLTVARLSRFQSKADQIETVRKLATGGIDIVVGTHRLLSPDVRFKDLGLLVIDEEQRFGVAHKERIKKAKTQVDVLTLTATPIPRTLHIAMAGVRDLSIIATPPTDRRAVRTFVSRVDDTTIREAIEREIARGGQVFFISPTIGLATDHSVSKGQSHAVHPSRRRRDDERSLQDWADYIHQLVPSARIGIGHGSLSAEALEKVMLQFMQGELDVLVATTIVESGIDIPRANTMFVARADAFGLAQLYQLRGRIGRSKDRAYCYLLVPQPEHISDSARRRLEALQRFTELGAGFHIASQDLEIRGGGELLGAKQSGSIAAVGFDQYIKMLERSVAELRGEPIHSEVDPELTVDVPGFIPDDYIPDPGQRLEMYKRLSAVADDDDLARLMGEIADRYGPIPGDAIILGELMAQKALARRIGALALEISPSRIAVALADDSPAMAAVLAAGWRRLPDGRFATTPPARQALLTVLARATEHT